jgi:hypothetical protein
MQDSNFSKRECCHGISDTPLKLCAESAKDPILLEKPLEQPAQPRKEVLGVLFDLEHGFPA